MELTRAKPVAGPNSRQRRGLPISPRLRIPWLRVERLLAEMGLPKTVRRAGDRFALRMEQRRTEEDGALLIEFKEMQPEGQREFLVRVKANLKRQVLERYADGSALMEIRSGKKRMLVREISGRVRRGNGSWSEVRLWTSLLDWKKHPASELLALYARRWEQESFYRELKVDMRSSPLVQSHTPLTAAQEIAALIMAYAILVDERIAAAKVGEDG